MRNGLWEKARLSGFAVAALLLTAACGGGGDQGGRAPDVPERVGRVDLSIGQLEGPAEYAFGRVSGVAEGPGGEIYVSDSEAGAIRVFDAQGTFVRTLGREGQGPGEMERPCCIAFGPEQLLWVRDGGNRRYDSYAVAEDPPKPVGTVRMVHSDGSLYAPITFMPGGELVDVGHRTGEDGALGLWRFVVARDGTEQSKTLVPEPTEEALGTVVKDRQIPGGMLRNYFPQPFGPASLVAHGPDGRWATAVSSRYSITLRHDTSTVEIRGSVGEGPVLAREERERASEQLQDYVKRGGGQPSDYPSIPNRKTPLADMFFDVTGRLWVQLNVPADSARRADLYDTRGDLVERRVWPARVSLHVPAWVGREQALGIETDSLGVQRVVRVRFHD